MFAPFIETMRGLACIVSRGRSSRVGGVYEVAKSARCCGGAR